ncbi:hypothetical protein CBR_g17047 [Chara braunii]|uniref:Uncharacterized protein n=1 Tax=Chara braunii TaxID=69332 RepID=A0A388KUH3_CHABU|nr:hypothetical protein CBR_g17047 [Chara braunii]|eukprot:GBG73706.1 hypothetical protein CBR_g17047 [Chara braunii]
MANAYQQGGMGAPGYRGGGGSGGGGFGAQPNAKQYREGLPEPVGGVMAGSFAGQQIPLGVPPMHVTGGAQQTPPAGFPQAGVFPPDHSHACNPPSKPDSTPHTLQSIVSISCMAAFLLLSIVTVALLGAADSKYWVLRDFLAYMKSAA